MKAVEEITKRGLNVREAEALVKKLLTKKERKKILKLSEEYQAIEDKFRNYFGTRVKLMNGKKSGRILIEYYSMEELDRIVNAIDGLPLKKTTS